MIRACDLCGAVYERERGELGHLCPACRRPVDDVRRADDVPPAPADVSSPLERALQARPYLEDDIAGQAGA